VIGRERARRQAGNDRRERHCEDGAPAGAQDARTWQHIPIGKPGDPAVAPVFPHRDQSDDRTERHLEARLHDALRPEPDDDERRDGEVAHRDRRPVDQDCPEHDRRHHIGAHRRRTAAGEREVDGDHQKRRDSRPFADREAQR